MTRQLLPFRLRRHRPAPELVALPTRWLDAPGAVQFETAWARHRYIDLGWVGDSVRFIAPRTRDWPGRPDPETLEPQVVSRQTLPDTVTCGAGYIEVLAFTNSGVVVTEVRTHGDPVIVVPS